MKRSVFAIVLIMAILVCPTTTYTSVCAKSKSVGICSMSSNYIKYQRIIGSAIESDAPLYGGKKIKMKLARKVKFYSYYFKNSGGMGYRRISRSQARSRISSYERYCTLKIKNGKVIKIYIEYLP